MSALAIPFWIASSKLFAEVDVREPLRKKLGERSYRYEGILNLMSDTRSKRAEGSKSFGSLFLVLELL